MKITRRQTILMGAAAAIVVPSLGWASATDDAIAAFTGGAEVQAGDGLTLTAPEIAENGNTVPIEVSAPGAEAILVLAAGNPAPEVGEFKFGPLSGEQMASTRIRLAGTQEVIAIAKMPDGSFQRASQEVKVTIGGCGG